MIPLFAIGVFTGFTLSQAGLVVHWWRERPPRWHYRALVNGFGAVVTALATLVFLVSKFAQGAWVVVLAVPAFVLLFVRIHAYYQLAGLELGVGSIPTKPVGRRTLVIVPVTSVSRLTEYALAEALSMGQEVVAVSVAMDPGVDGPESEELERAWAQWNPGPPLRILHTDFTSVVQPIVAFIDDVQEHSDQQIVVLIPVVIPERLRYRLLHNQIDLVLSAALRSRPDVVVAHVAMPLRAPAVDPTA